MKKMPLVALLALVGLLGITGFPGFNGYASKTLLHHGLIQVMEKGAPSLQLAEWLFKAAGVGTVAYAIKFYYYVFLKRADTILTNRSVITPYGVVVGPSRWMIPVMGLLAVLVIGIGLVPGFLLEKIVVPGAMMVSRVPALVDIRLSGFAFWSAKDLQGTGLVLALGTLLYLFGQQLHIITLQLPTWPSAEHVLLHPVTSFCQRFSSVCERKFQVPVVFGDALVYALVLVGIMGMLVFRQFF